jgi:hypothetical protein
MAELVKNFVEFDTKYRFIRYQIMMYLYEDNIRLTDAELDLLALIIQRGYSKELLYNAVELGIYKKLQSTRNVVNKLTKLQILYKSKHDRILNSKYSIARDSKTVIQKIIKVNE